MTKSTLQRLEEKLEQIESGARPRENISLLGRGIRYLSMREHSEAELRKKLSPHAISEEELENAILKLKAKNFLSNERFTENLVHKKSQGLGMYRLAQEFRKHELDQEITTQYLKNLKVTEPQRALDVWKKKFGTLTNDPKELAKQIRFLVSRGFDQELIYRIVRGKTLD